MTVRYFFILFAGLAFNSCHHSPDKTQEKFFETEIKDRISILNNIDADSDSIKIGADAIHAEVNKILLLSKDIENLGASVSRANKFFKSSAARYDIEVSEFAMLNTTMHVDAIAHLLKQNELNLLNQLLFKSGKGTVQLHSVK